MAITMTGNVAVSITDTLNVASPITKTVPTISFNGVAGQFTEYMQLASGANAITLPVSPCQFVYIKNLHASNTIAVSWTPTGGVTAIVNTLQPGGFILLTQPAAGSGITVLSLNASGASTPCEMFLGG